MFPDITPIKPNEPKDKVSGERLRPEGVPRSSKDFKKLVQGYDSKNKEKDEDDIDVDEDASSSVPSLFDLSANKKVKPKTVANRSSPWLNKNLSNADQPVKEVPQEALEESKLAFDEELPETNFYDEVVESEVNPNDPSINLSRRKRFEIPANPLFPDDDDMIASKDDSEKIVKFDPKYARLSHDAVESDVPTLAPKDKIKKTQTPSGHFSQENGDLSAINPAAGQPLFVDEKRLSDEKAAIPSRSLALRQLIEKIVEGIQTIKREGITETVVTIKYPPLLDGAKITLTSFDNARNEFSIGFSELSVAAKQFLDQRIRKDSLANALEDQGFVIHTITTSTLPATPGAATYNEQERMARDDREQQREGKKDQRNPQQQDENA